MGIPVNDPGHRRLIKLGRAVSGDEPVDWDAECQEAPLLRQTLRRLQQLQALERAHRSIGASIPGPGAPPVLFHWGPLEVVEHVGRGSFGDVYRAIDPRLRRDVALKLRHAAANEGDTSARRFLDEARTLARVRHPNVLVVHGADVHDRRAGFWTDFIRGETLAQRIQREGPFGAEEAASIGLALCRALAAVHAAGLLHGDVKAANVMREEGGRIVLMDFGASHGQAPSGLGGEAAFGTPLVLAPEVLRGAPPGPDSDLYSLGVLLYQLVTGRHPIEAGSMAELLQEHERRRRTPVRDLRPDLPAVFVHVVERALDPDASLRFESAGAMEHALLDSLRSSQEGQTLRSLLEELGRVPEELARRIAQEIARGSARGPHGALELESIVLRSDGSVRLPAAREREPWERTLRALGSLLVELLTGEPVRGTEFPRPEDTIPAISPFLRELVKRLLAPEAGGFLGSPQALLLALSDGEKAPWWREHVRTLRRASRRPASRMQIARETAVHGRGEELRKLRDRFDFAKAGSGRVVLIDGEAGIGKTRLVDEFIAGLEREGEDLSFLSGSYPPGGASTAAGAFLSAYRENLGDERLEETLQDYLGSAPLLIPAFASLLRGERGGDGSEVLTKDSLQVAFVQVTRALAADRPTVVLIDDLHFAPQEGLALFAALALAVPGHRVLLIGSFRPELPEGWMAGLLRQEHCSHLTVSRLAESDVLRILAEALHSELAAEELTPAIATRCDGNPLFVLENLRALEEGRILTRAEDGSWQVTGSIPSFAVPSSIRHLIQARFAALSEGDRELLDVACCHGFEFDPGLVADVLGIEILPALRRFAMVEKRHGLIRAAGRRYAFDHHQIQEALYEGLFGPLREQVHVRIAEALERRESALEKPTKDLDGSVAVMLCEHYLRGGRGVSALRYLEAALDHLEATLRTAAAVDLMDRALGAGGLVAGVERFDLLSRKSRRLFILGRPAEEEASLTEMLRIADAAGDPLRRSKARRSLGDLTTRVGRLQEAQTLLEEAVDCARACGDAEEQSRVCQMLGGLYLAMSRNEEARTFYEHSVEFARRAGNRLLEAQGAAAVGVACHDLNQFDEAEKSYKHHLEVCRGLRDRPGVAIATGNLGALALDLERFDEALFYFEEQLKLSRGIGFRYTETLATGNLAILFRALGRCADALAQNERYVKLAREIGNRVVEADGLQHLGITLLVLGRREDARAIYTQCLSFSRVIHHSMSEAYALVGLGAVEEQAADLLAAAPLYEEAQAIWAGISTSHGIPEGSLRLGSLYRQLDRVEDARAHLLEALRCAREARSGSWEVLASSQLALLPAGDLDGALRSFAVFEPRLSVLAKMEARYLLWQATADPVHLEAAHELLTELRSAAPERDRETMIQGVPLYRAIETAWLASRS